MVDEGRSEGAYGGAQPWEDHSGRTAGTILAAAVAAGVIAFLVRRSREEPPPPVTGVARFARGLAASDNLEAGRDFLVDKVLPELKPALLSALSEIEDVVDQTFRRIEKNIKRL